MSLAWYGAPWRLRNHMCSDASRCAVYGPSLSRSDPVQCPHAEVAVAREPVGPEPECYYRQPTRPKPDSEPCKCAGKGRSRALHDTVSFLFS